MACPVQSSVRMSATPRSEIETDGHVCSRACSPRLAPGPWSTAPKGLVVCLWAAALVGCGVEGYDDGIEGVEEGSCPHEMVGGTRSKMTTCPSGGRIAPTTPTFGASVDKLASYVGQSTCDPTAKPGVKAFRDLILKTYPCTASYGITRACSSGGKSEHKEGRAWDWKLSYPHPAADSVIKWLLATDKHGNKYAMARRVGLMYMIWNRRIWSAYRAEQGWRTYTGSNPHTDHIHFSFSWAGARKQTSFWTSGTTTPPPSPTPTNKPPTGKLDGASCNKGIVGWAQDPDSKQTAIKVTLSFDGDASKSADTITISADKKRSDLCTAIGSCNHGFALAIPALLRDDKQHTVYAYAVDSKSRSIKLLGGSPAKFTCKAASSGGNTDAQGPDGKSGLGDDGGSQRSPGRTNGASGGRELVGQCSMATPTTGLPLLPLLFGLLLRRRRRASRITGRSKA